MIQNDILQFRTLISQAQNILVALASDSDEDELAAALSLYLLLKSKNKQITIVSPQKVKVGQAYLFGVDKIQSTVSGSSNLVVSLPYQEGTIEKVSYNIEGNRFNLVIEPRGENLNFDPKQIEYQYGKGDFDMIITVGADEPSQLGNVYSKMPRVFTDKPVVNIDKSASNTKFGKINLLNNSSASRVVTLVFKYLNMQLDPDTASNLLTGLSMTVDKFDIVHAQPEDLEAAAYLMRAGAKVLNEGSQQEVSTSLRKQGSFSRPQTQQVQPVQNVQQPSQQQTVSQTIDQPVKQPSFQQQNAQEVKKQENPTFDRIKQEPEAPEDWLKPKIFTTNKGSTLI